ncbi:MAG: hypothetical protein NXI04_24365 [Planctomycetaceae bacterium]|nr:hypothetical protein [Planctomycetaceae bacterium]
MTTNSPEDKPLLPAPVTLVILAVMGAVLVPLFVCAPVTSDTSLFDVQAMTALRGGVLYRDVIEPNLPGVVWVHMAVRTVIGWSSEAIRVFDLAVFLLTACLLCSFVHRIEGRAADPNRATVSRPPLLLFAFLFLSYVTRNEWCHCQRDSWMLLPTACALWLRRQRSQASLPAVLSACAEGAFWGIAFWIKPHVAVPALAVMTVDRRRHCSWRDWLVDNAWVICGGVAAALPGILWLIVNGAWSHFWEMMLEWNPDYLEAGRQRRSLHRLSLMFQRFHPWGLIHLLAVPLALLNIRRLWQHRTDHVPSAVIVATDKRAVISAVYLAWLWQTFLLQHAMDYIHVPEILLAMVVVAGFEWQLDVSVRRGAVVFALSLLIVMSPPLRPQRLLLWPRCLQEGSSPPIRAQLAQGNFPDWEQLDRVQHFLRKNQVRDREVTCFNVHSIHLHQELGILPATRYWTVLTPLTMFPRRFDQIMHTIESSRHRYVVLEERETSHEGQVRPSEFPREYPVVFEAGSYKVYQVPDQRAATISRLRR